MKQHHQISADGSGYYSATTEGGQGLTLGGRVEIVRTIGGVVKWHDDNGTVTTAWHGEGWTDTGAGAHKRAQLEANAKMAELRRYLMLNDRRWEIVKEQERQRRQAEKKAAAAAAELLRKAAPDLLAALKLAEGRLAFLLSAGLHIPESDHPTGTEYVLGRVRAEIAKATPAAASIEVNL